ncbi:Neuroligin-2 [Dissostichus eleginoides]|uniref:Neuroligin-2 n=1 Tax=Dissostichus eleginoides TaxID=100907 RepID=A0AAD9BZR6_DISEL|nr:Neuroligin-2 [Dissostichus eleginoides]
MSFMEISNKLLRLITTCQCDQILDLWDGGGDEACGQQCTGISAFEVDLAQRLAVDKEQRAVPALLSCDRHISAVMNHCLLLQPDRQPVSEAGCCADYICNKESHTPSLGDTASQDPE